MCPRGRAQVGSTSTSQYNSTSNRIPIIPLATLIAGTVKAEEPKTIQEPLEVIVYTREEIRKEFEQYLQTLNGYLNVEALDPSVDLRLHKVLKNYVSDQCNLLTSRPDAKS